MTLALCHTVMHLQCHTVMHLHCMCNTLALCHTAIHCSNILYCIVKLHYSDLLQWTTLYQHSAMQCETAMYFPTIQTIALHCFELQDCSNFFCIEAQLHSAVRKKDSRSFRLQDWIVTTAKISPDFNHISNCLLHWLLWELNLFFSDLIRVKPWVSENSLWP